MTTVDKLLGHINTVLADQEQANRAMRAWLASTTPGAPATVQRALGTATCPPRPPEPPVTEQTRAPWWKRVFRVG